MDTSITCDSDPNASVLEPMDTNVTQDSQELVLNNPYLIARIVSELDIRSLFASHSVSKDFFDASAYEYEKRKDIIHLYLLNYEFLKESPLYDSQRLFESFSHYSNRWLNMRPKHVLVLIGGYRQDIDYRRKENSVQQMSAGLPKDCQITYLDVGKTVLTSSIRWKSLTNFSGHQNQSDRNLFQRTAFPCLTSLLIPDIEGIEVNAYYSAEEVNTKDVSCVLFFESSRLRDRTPKGVLRDSQTTDAINQLVSRIDNNVSFGGGSVIAAKTLSKCPFLLDHIFLTFGGHRVRTASFIMSTTDSSAYFEQLSQFKNSLDFELSDPKTSTSIAFIFANSNNFDIQFTSAFQYIFPFVGMFGFQSNDRMFGQLLDSNSWTDGRKNCIQSLNANTNSVIVLVNFEFSKYHSK
ncbi:unnamed protein product [Medioppia subpectinata]|uniref:F-box domain-containing protein n=1 Tax=Medioppia subpectinata TaxID=1979941 RepID=A0A7R9KBY5_9ACAR|nr:unnamed protein product [Medioppia subpectinata]CAG2100649.1 unnamed protein product [Medioppia subpectinata]